MGRNIYRIYCKFGVGQFKDRQDSPLDGQSLVINEDLNPKLDYNIEKFHRHIYTLTWLSKRKIFPQTGRESILLRRDHQLLILICSGISLTVSEHGTRLSIQNNNWNYQCMCARVKYTTASKANCLWTGLKKGRGSREIQSLGLWVLRGPESDGLRLVEALSYIKLGGPLFENDTKRSHKIWKHMSYIFSTH